MKWKAQYSRKKTSLSVGQMVFFIIGLLIATSGVLGIKDRFSKTNKTSQTKVEIETEPIIKPKKLREFRK
jgi:hypothetical protein